MQAAGRRLSEEKLGLEASEAEVSRLRGELEAAIHRITEGEREADALEEKIAELETQVITLVLCD
jgi:predicted  nucleic acid-binding Zn-ribbon protein